MTYIKSPQICWRNKSGDSFTLYPVEDRFWEAMVNRSNHVFEYVHQPERKEVEEDFIDYESERALDEYDKEFGADGARWQATQMLVVF
jgi:hypothetical protein